MAKSVYLVGLIAFLTVVLVVGSIIAGYSLFGRMSDSASTLSPAKPGYEKTGSGTGESPDTGAVRIEILRDESGQTFVRIGKRTFGFVSSESGQKVPDYKAVEDYLYKLKEKSLKESALLKIVIVSEHEDFKHVIRAVDACVSAGIENIEFSSGKSFVDEHFDELESLEKQRKQE